MSNLISSSTAVVVVGVNEMFIFRLILCWYRLYAARCWCSHYAKIQDFDGDFYSQFHIVVCGLDSIVARRWINGMLVSLLVYNEGVLDPSRYSKQQY